MTHRPQRVILAGLLLAWALALAVHAQESAPIFTLHLPFGPSEATPAWLGHPINGTGAFATLDLPITPPEAGAALLVTLFFQEKNGGFLRVSWQGGAAAVGMSGGLPDPGEADTSAVLCENFYEGIGMANQRSLLISADTLKRAGMLHLQCGDATLGLSRIKLEWLQSAIGLASSASTELLVTPADGKTQPASVLAGLPSPAQDPAWQGRIVNVPLTDVPLRIEQGVDFTVQLDGAPSLARLGVKETGLPWGQHLVVWINNQRAGIVFPAVPELGDAGYPDDKAAPYVGWREGSLYVPVSLLKAGNNTLQISGEPDVTSSTPADSDATSVPLALKDVTLQMNFPANTTPSVAATGGTASVPDASVPLATGPATQASTPSAIGSAPAAPSPEGATTPVPNTRDPSLLSLPLNSPSGPDPNAL